MKAKSTLISGLIMVAIITIITIFMFQQDTIRINRKFDWNWFIMLDKDNTHPYGLYYVYNSIKGSVPASNFTLIDTSVSQQLMTSSTGNAYILIGNRFHFTPADVDTICKFVYSGNVAFISSDDFDWLYCNDASEVINDDLYYNTGIDYYYYRNDVELVLKSNPDISYVIKASDSFYNTWNYFSEITPHVDVICYMDGLYPTHIAIPYGEGIFYLHSNPLMLSNFFLVHEPGLSYFNTCLEPLADKKLYWDEASKYWQFPEGERTNFLWFIHSNRELNWAWHILLIGILVFIVFRSKRIQRIIPVTVRPVNHSSGYAKLVSALYYRSNYHKHIVVEMRNQFLNFLAIRYGLKISLKNYDYYIPRIAKASGISENNIRETYKLWLELEVSTDDSKRRLIRIDELFDYFYKNCK